MRKGLLSVLLAVSMFSSIPAMAQDEDFGKSAVAQSLLKRASAPADETRRTIEAPKPVTPWAYREEVPENVDDLMKNVELQNGALVEEFEKLIEKDPLNPDAPKWLSQIAEFHWQMSHYAYLRARRAWFAELEKCTDDESKCPPEPVADYKQSIADYRRLLAEYPTYEKLDDVLFRLGDALIRNQQAKEGISYLHRLTQNYPQYKDLDAAYLAMGEFYFSQKITGTAQAAYQKLLDDYPTSAYRQYAQYKLAWTYLNLADEDSYRAAIELFKQVVESIDSQYASAIGADGQIDENKLKSGEVSFRNQALNDLSTTFAELPDGWKQARDYLSQKLPPDKARDKIEQLGGILNAQGKFEEELELYAELISANPTHPHLIDWHIARIEAFKASNRLDEAEKETRTAIAATIPDTPWHAANAGDQSAVKAAARFNSAQIYALAMAAIVSTEKITDDQARDAAWADAEKLLRTELAHYDEGEASFDIHYSFAFVLDERSDAALKQIKKQYGKRLKTEPERAADVLPRLREAAQAYQDIIDWKDVTDPDRLEQIRVAANRQVFVYANILASSDPEWSIINSAKAQNFVEEKRGSEILAKEDLSEAELGFVRSAEQFADRYPKDDETPAFLWRAAEIYRSHNDYDQAAGRFDQIISNFPDHQYAAVSVGSMFELYSKAKNYAKIEYWAKWLIEHRNFKHYTAAELEDTAAFAIDRQAVALADAEKIDDAVSTIMRIESSFPNRAEHITAARFKAASFEESRRRFKDAADILAPLESSADTPRNRAHAAYRIAENDLKIARFDESADAYMRAADAVFAEIAAENEKRIAEAAKKPKKSKKSAETPETTAKQLSAIPDETRLEAVRAVLNGTQLYKQLGDSDKAAHLLDLYLAADDLDVCRIGDDIKLCPQNDADAVPVINHALAILERASLDASHAESAARLDAVGSEQLSALEPRLARQIKFQKIQYAVDAGMLEKAKSELKSFKPDESWSNAENARRAYLEGRCAQLEFDAVALEFPIRTLRKRIEEKAKKRQHAETFYKQAISFKNARVSTASAYELAQMALRFRDAFRELPPPKELENDPQALDEYTIWIEDELVFPAEDAAASLLDVAHQITVQLESYTPQSLKSAKSLAELKPDLYPVTKSSVVMPD